MATATMTSKGQITVPQKVREDLNLAAGSRVEFIKVAPGHYEFVAVTVPVQSLKGLFKRSGTKPVTLAEMDAAVIAGAKRRAAR